MKQKRIAITVAALFLPTFAAAADAELPEVKVKGQTEGKDFAPAVSSIGGATPTLIRDIPQTVTVINRAVLDSQGAASLTQALRNVPGITISAGEGGAIGDNINLRGFSARTDIYIDGFRDRGQYTRDTFAYDEIEVLKGPSSMLFGRGSTGGVINQVSKKPGLKPRSEITASAGTNDYYRTTLDLNRPLSETSAFRVAALPRCRVAALPRSARTRNPPATWCRTRIGAWRRRCVSASARRLKSRCRRWCSATATCPITASLW